MSEEQVKKVRYSYDQIHQIVKDMADKIKNDHEIDLIISIATGGWIPARILRTFLPNSSNLPLPLFSIGIVNYDSKDRLLSETLIVQRLPEKLDLTNKNVLIMDEVADSGGTFLKAVEYISSLSPKNLFTGVLHLKKQSSFKPDFVGEFAGNNWIVYPWDAK